MIHKMIDSLKCLLREKYWETTTKDHAFKDKKAPMQVNVTGLSNNGLIISGLERKSHFNILNEQKDYDKFCDYLIFVPHNGCIDVYFIEMKTTLNFDIDGVPDVACKQILCSIPTLDYLISMVKIHFGKEQKINKHFIVIAEKISKRLDKQKVKADKLKKCKYKNEQFKIIHSTLTIPFASLK